MTGRERLAAALHHRAGDRVAVDFGASFVTGIHVAAVTRLRRHLLGDPGCRVRVSEPYQMLGEIDDALRAALPIDVIGVLGRKSIFGTDGGFVFDAIHNIQGPTPVENMLALFRAITDSARG